MAKWSGSGANRRSALNDDRGASGQSTFGIARRCLFFIVLLMHLMQAGSSASPYDPYDQQRVEAFLSTYNASTRHRHLEKRSHVLDDRIRDANLSLPDKMEAFRRLSPGMDATDFRRELRMERLLLSVAPNDLSSFKFALEYDGDYKDLVEYVFHDIDDRKRRARILDHFRSAPRQIGVKVLTDVDDTMVANLIDERYPRTPKSLYPGVLEFYDALKEEPFEPRAIPVTTLSARPNPIAGHLEESSLKALVELSKGRLCPSALSGALPSAVVGTMETVLRTRLDYFYDEVPHGREDQIGRVKFKNFRKFSRAYPEYRFVFVGDSGQADALTALRGGMEWIAMSIPGEKAVYCIRKRQKGKMNGFLDSSVADQRETSKSMIMRWPSFVLMVLKHPFFSNCFARFVIFL